MVRGPSPLAATLLHFDVGRPDHLPHFSVSSAMSLPKSAGEPESTESPRSPREALIRWLARPALISLLSFSMITADVFLGAPIPCQALASKPGRKSPIVGIPGSDDERSFVVTANARKLPVLMCSTEGGMSANATCICPPSRSVNMGAEPRYAT